MFMNRLLPACVMATLMCAGTLCAQVDRGTLAGSVTDPTGASVPGANVSVANVATRVQFRTVTNGKGEFVAPDLIPGRYEVVVSHPGFETLERRDLIIEAAARLAVSLTLQLGSVTQTVQVSGEVTPLLQKESATVTGLLETRAVAELPTVDRTVFNLADLMPGAVMANVQSNSTGIPDNARAAMALNINGLGNSNAVNSFTLDGVTDTDASATASYIGILPPLEAIQEFKIDTSGSAADMGMGGTTVNIVLKSGTNQFHGDAFEFLRNSSLDARNFFDIETAATPFRLPEFQQNQFGGTLGGPIKKDRTFFFVDYQGFRQNEGYTWVSDVPDAAVKNGDFSNTSQQIFDPATYNAALNTRAPFAGNIINSSRFSPAAMKILKYFPLPNNPSGVINSLGVGEFYSTSTGTRDQDSFDVKLDDRLSDRDTFTARYSYERANALLPGAFTDLPQYAPAQGGSLLPGVDALQYLPGLVSNPAQQAALGWIHDFNPTTINEARASWLRSGADATQLGYGHDYADQLGIPNANVNLINSGFPDMDITGVTGIGESGANPDINIENSFQFLDNLTLIRGSHTFQTGGDFIRFRQTFFQLLGGTPGGSFTFEQYMTSNPAELDTTGNAMADFLLGLPEKASLGLLKGSLGLRWNDIAGYFQDTWRVSRKLTATYGLRYEYMGMPVEMDNRITNLDLATRSLVLPGQGPAGSCLATRAQICEDWKNFEPRLGIAWAITPKTVWRMDYALQSAMGDRKSLSFRVLNAPNTGGETYVNTPVPQQITRTLDQGFEPLAPYAPITDPADFIDVVNPNLKEPYTQQFSAGIQRELASNLVLEVSFVGNTGSHYDGQYDSYNLDQPALGTGSSLEREPFYSTMPGISSIGYFDWRGRAHYDSLQTTLTKRFGHGLSLLATYTWSHDIGSIPQQDQIDQTMGDTQIDARNRFAANFLYELPFGRGMRFGRNLHPVLNTMLGGWRLGTVLQFQSGYPYTVTDTAGFNPNRICNGQTVPGGHTVQEWFNTSCFPIPAPVTDPATGEQYIPYGNAGFYELTGDGIREFDLSLAKSFYVGREGRVLDFRAEFFNVINNVQFLPPLAEIGSGTAGEVTGANPAREIQLALEYTF
jgi:Carboxypeptidase regulatory-like domain